MSDWTDDPRAREWLRQVRKGLVPKLQDSAMSMVLVTGEVDVKFAVELGLSILMDKPIIVAVTPGTPVPDKLVRIADEIVEFGPDNSKAIAQAVERVMARIEAQDVP